MARPAPQRQKPYNYEEEMEQPLVIPKEETPKETAKEIANEIEQNIGRLMDLEEPVQDTAPKPLQTDSTIKFTNLQFGRNYDPTNG